MDEDIDQQPAETTPSPGPAPGPEVSPSDAPASSEQSPTASTTAPADPGDSIHNVLHEIQAEHLHVGEQSINYESHFHGGPESAIEELGPGLFNPLSVSHLERIWQISAIDQVECQTLEQTLQKHRWAIVVGAPEVGKGTLAFLAALQLASRAEPSYPVAESAPLRSTVRVRLSRLAEALGRGIWIFRDFLATEHEDWLEWLNQLDAARAASLSDRLRNQQAFLVLTSDGQHLRSLDALPRSLGVLHETQGPPSAVLGEWFREAVSRRALLARWQGEALHQALDLLAREGERILSTLRTAPRLQRFLDLHLLDVVEGRLALDDALARGEDLSVWLLKDLSDDLETWAFVLSLALCQPCPPYVGAPWFQVYGLWRELSRALRQTWKLREPLAPPASSEARLELARAEIQRLPSAGFDIVRFRDVTYPDRLWRALMGPGRELASLILPWLRRLADQPTPGTWTLRAAAARALGRLGEMDPHHLTLPLSRSWQRSKDEALHLAAGQLLQGAVASEDLVYRALCLRQLDPEKEEAEGDKAWPKAIALRDIGVLHLDTALEGLVSLLKVNVEGHPFRLDALRADRLQRLTEELRDHALRPRTASEPVPSLDDEARALATGFFFWKQTGVWSALEAVQFSLVGLCFVRDPIEAIAGFGDLLRDPESERLVPVLTLLVLRANGVLDVLARNPIMMGPLRLAGARRPSGLNRLFCAASVKDRGPQELARTVDRLFSGTSLIPGLFGRALRSRLLQEVKGWAEQAGPQEDLHPTLEEILVELLRVDSPDLKDSVFQMLRNDDLFTEEGSSLRNVARRALRPRLR